jgi:thioredoxin 1
MLININGEGQFQAEVDKGGVKVIKFGASWCAPCKVVDKELELLATEIDADILKVDVDLDAEIAGEFQVMSIPTIIIIKDKEFKSHTVGLQTKENLKQMIEAVSNEGA